MSNNRHDQLEKILLKAEKSPPAKQPLWSIIADNLDRIIAAKNKGVLFSDMAVEMGVSARTFSAALQKAKAYKNKSKSPEEAVFNNDKSTKKHPPIAGSNNKFGVVDLS